LTDFFEVALRQVPTPVRVALAALLMSDSAPLVNKLMGRNESEPDASMQNP
jgi:hypothetical protein